MSVHVSLDMKEIPMHNVLTLMNALWVACMLVHLEQNLALQTWLASTGLGLTNVLIQQLSMATAATNGS